MGVFVNRETFENTLVLRVRLFSSSLKGYRSFRSQRNQTII